MTGAGAGLGRAYALMFAKLGANVVVNDVSQQGADAVVKEVEAGEFSRISSEPAAAPPGVVSKRFRLDGHMSLGAGRLRGSREVVGALVPNADFLAGGKAVAAVCSAEEGEQIVKAGLDAFGAVHVLVANAGILRDKSFMGMDEKMWDQVISVHLRGTYRVCLLSCNCWLLSAAKWDLIKAVQPLDHSMLSVWSTMRRG